MFEPACLALQAHTAITFGGNDVRSFVPRKILKAHDVRTDRLRTQNFDIVKRMEFCFTKLVPAGSRFGIENEGCLFLWGLNLRGP